MKTCVIYANCLGEHLRDILQAWPSFSTQYRIEYIPNYRYMEQRTELPRELLERTDLFVYQAVDRKREVYSTHPDYPNGIANILKKEAIRIGFPYVYNDGFFIMFEEGTDINNKKPVLRLKERGYSLENILKEFTALTLDFEIRKRFDHSLAVLEEKESECDIKVSPLIRENFHTSRLFYTQNHVSNVIICHIVNEVLRKIDIEEIPREKLDSEKMSRFIWPLSPYEIRDLNLNYEPPGDNWIGFYAHLITRVFRGDFQKHRDLYTLNLLQV